MSNNKSPAVPTFPDPQLSETASNGRGSIRSSDDASGSAFESSPSASLVDQRFRIERKIEKIRNDLMRVMSASECDVDEYLRITSKINQKPENPQMLRLKQHFEKKNKRNAQEVEQLQKKLEEYEQRLNDLEHGGEEALRGNHHGVLHNVGHGIKRTGVNLKEMTGSVISAPFGIAQKVKKNMFGSADDIRGSGDGGGNVGQSIFYMEEPLNYPGSQSDRGHDLVSSKPNDQEEAQYAAENADDRLTEASSDQLTRLSAEISTLRQKLSQSERFFEQYKKTLEVEIKDQRAELSNARFQVQQLEQTLNETIELHQNEVKQLKNEINVIATRMDYQYNDRFKKIEESVESTQNRIFRMETSWHENSEKLLGAGHNMWNALMLSGANIVVELLKIALYFTAVLLDSVKPLTGTRKRAGFLLLILLLTFVLWNVFGIGHRINVFLFHQGVSATAQEQILPNREQTQS
jgi:predicted  nucleic acid-binding Zn-ribbon protein